jgi:hypothetical protein
MAAITPGGLLDSNRRNNKQTLVMPVMDLQAPSTITAEPPHLQIRLDTAWVSDLQPKVTMENNVTAQVGASSVLLSFLSPQFSTSSSIFAYQQALACVLSFRPLCRSIHS